MQNDIETTVRDFITENFHYRGEIESLSESDSLLESGLIDSMGVLELVTFLESTFSIQVADQEVVPENLDTIGAIVSFVRRKCAVDQGELITHAR
ncbi:MAG: acyl carrier protein [Fimbriimonadales bacterium]